MKRIMKIIAIVGIASCLFGFGLFTIGYAFGGSKHIQTSDLNEVVNKALKAKEIFIKKDSSSQKMASTDKKKSGENAISKDKITSDGNSSSSDNASSDESSSSSNNITSDGSSSSSSNASSDGNSSSGEQKVPSTKRSCRQTSTNNSGYHTYKLDNKQLNSIHTITANLKNIDFSIKKSKDNYCYLSYELNCKNSKNPLTYSIKNGTLNLSESKGKASTYYVFWKNGKKTKYNYFNKATLYVPSKTVFNNSTVKMEIGDLTVNGLHTKNAQIELTDGDVSLRSTSFSEGKLSTKYGDIEAANSKVAGTFELITVDGDIQATGLTVPGNLQINTATGDINTSGLTISGNLQINTKDGDVDTSGLQISGSTKINASCGDITTSGMNLQGKLEIFTRDGDLSFSGSKVSGTLLANTECGDISASAFNLSGKAVFNTKDGDVSLQLQKNALDRTSITLDTTDGEMSVGKSFGGKKKKRGEDGWYYAKTAVSGKISLKATTKWGDIALQ